MLLPYCVSRQRSIRSYNLIVFIAGLAQFVLWPAASAYTGYDLRRDEAQQHYDAGLEAYSAGDTERARAEFTETLNLIEGGSMSAPTATEQIPLLEVPYMEPLPTSSASSSTAPAGSTGTMGTTTTPFTDAGMFLGERPTAVPPPASTFDGAATILPPGADAAIAAASPRPAGTRAVHYQIAIGDLLFVSVWQVPDLTRDVSVRPDGQISYPLIGDVPAQGLTLTELDQIITEQLKTYVRDPQVTVELKGMAQQRVAVLGEVNKQGLHLMPGRAITVPDAIALSEGFRRVGAKIKDIAVLKGYPNNPQLYHLDAKALLTEGTDPQRITLSGGDIVFVSRSWVGNAHAFVEATTPLLNNVFQGLTTYALYDTIVTAPNPGQ